MNKLILPAVAAAAFAAGGLTMTGVAEAQNRGNPLEDFLRSITRDQSNRQALGCNVTRRLARDGDIVYLRMDCRAYGRR